MTDRTCPNCGQPRLTLLDTAARMISDGIPRTDVLAYLRAKGESVDAAYILYSRARKIARLENESAP